MKRRDIILLKLLAKQNDYITSKQICSALGIRPRTLREDLKNYRSFVTRESGARIESKSNQGYRLIVDDEKKFFEFMQNLLKVEQSQQYLMPVLQKDRVNYILRYFLSRSEPSKSEELADLMYISRSTLSADLKIVKDYLSYFHLTIESKVGEGLWIQGTEFNIRACIAQYFFHIDDFDRTQLERSPSPIFNKEMYEKVKQEIYDLIVKYQFKMTDISFQNLIIHILITIYRIRSKPESILLNIEQPELRSTREWKIAEDISQKIGHQYNLKFPLHEVGYITIHLLGKKVFDRDDDKTIDLKTLNIVRDIFQTIKEQYRLNFLGDVELFTMLSLHIQPLISRVTYGLKLHNPLVERIKQDNTLAFDIAVSAGTIITKALGQIVDEGELAYLALHFQLALERSYQKTKKRVLIVCASGAGTSQILLYKVQSIFKNFISGIDLLSQNQVQSLDNIPYDLILTTIPIHVKTNVPVIQVNYLLDLEDIHSIETTLHQSDNEIVILKQSFRESLFYTHQVFHNRDAVIRYMVEKMKGEVEVPEEFLSSVLEREKLASTALGNFVAIPHPMQLILDENVIVVCHLEQPVLWDKQLVDLIFLLGIKKNEDDAVALLGRTLTEMFHQPGLISQIRSNPEYGNFMEMIFEQFSQQRRKRNQSIFA